MYGEALFNVVAFVVRLAERARPGFQIQIRACLSHLPFLAMLSCWTQSEMLSRMELRVQTMSLAPHFEWSKLEIHLASQVI